MKCKKCGQENPCGAKYCGYCQNKLNETVVSAPSGKRRNFVAGIALAVLLLILAVLPWPCSHEWTDATCTEAKVCIKCEDTEGKALGHEWKKATCTEPAKCTRCSETNGTALEHQWSQFIETDYVEAKVISYSLCTACNEIKDKNTDDLMTLLSDDGKIFRIPPTEYFKRFDTILSEMDADVECSFVADTDDVYIELLENGNLSGMVFFYKDRKTEKPVSILGKDKNKEAMFGSIQMVINRDSSELDALLTAFVAACEPVCATDPNLAYEIVVGALEYSGEGVVFPYGSLAFLMNISEDFVILNAAPPQISK